MKTKEFLRLQFGSTDLEHLAVAIYHTFHGEYLDEYAEGWKLYKKYKDDITVQAMRAMAYEVICFHDCEFPDIGAAYYSDLSPDQDSF